MVRHPVAKSPNTLTRDSRARSRRGQASDLRSQARDSRAKVDPRPQGNSRAKAVVRRKPVSFPADNVQANRHARSRSDNPLTRQELEALWRPGSDFIGPVAPPMWLWQRDREKQALWRWMHGLR